MNHRKTLYVLGVLVAIAAGAWALDLFDPAALAVGSLAITAGAAIPEAEFQARVIDGVSQQGRKVKALEDRLDQYDSQTRSAFEDLTRIKKHANDVTSALNAIKRVQANLQRETRMAYGDPIERIAGDEEKRQRFNIAARLAVDQGGDMQRIVKNGFQGDLVKRALGEDSSPGSTMIDDALAADIYDTLSTYGIWDTFAVRNLGTKQTKYPVKTVRPVANVILTEGGTISDDTTKAGTSVTLEVELIATLLNVSIQLLQDSAFDVTADVMDDFAQAHAYRMDWFCTQADGGADATDGGMTGIFGGGGTAAAAASGNTTVETTDLEDWVRCLATVDAQVLMRSARWWIHPHLLVRSLSLKDGNGRPLFQTALEAPSAGAIGTILGYPVTLSHAAPSTNAANAKIAAFGDPNSQVVGVRSDFSFEASDHHKWNTFERSFRGIGRAGTKIRRATGFAILTLPAS